MFTRMMLAAALLVVTVTRGGQSAQFTFRQRNNDGGSARFGFGNSRFRVGFGAGSGQQYLDVDARADRYHAIGRFGILFQRNVSPVRNWIHTSCRRRWILSDSLATACEQCRAATMGNRNGNPSGR